MAPALRIIIIEDNPDDALLVVREVERAGYTVEAQRVQTAEELRDALAQGTWDLILADYSLPHFSAPEGLSILWETGLDVPFIVVSGSIGEETAVQLMRDGTTDYVMKDHLSRLGPVVQRELHDADERRHKRDAERALAESEKRYRLLVESQTDLIVKTDPDGRLLYANSTYCTLFGKSLEEMTGSGYQPLVHPDDLPSVKRAVAALSRPPHSCQYEARTMTTDGWRCIEWNTNAELDSKGTIVSLTGSGRDITERKEAEEELVRVKTLLSETEKTGQIGGWVFDAENLTQEWTEETFRILEIDAAEGEPKVPQGMGFIAPAFRPMAEQGVRRAIEFGESYDQEWEIITAKGNRKWVRAVARAYQEKGRTKRVSGSFQDITKRKELEREVVHLASFPAQNPYPVLEVGTDGVVRFANAAVAAALSQLGLDPDVRQFLPGTTEELALLRSKCEGQALTQELQLGGATFLRVVTAPPGQSSLRVYAVDITERKQFEQDLEESHERFLLANRATFNIIWDWNLQTDALWWNENFRAVFKYPLEEIEPSIESWATRIHPEDADRVVTGIHMAIDAGLQDWSDHYRFRRKDGSYAHIEDRGYIGRDTNGRPERMIGAMQDVTERKKAEEALRTSESDLRQAQAVAHVGSWRWDINSDRLIWSDEMFRIFGIAPEEFSGSWKAVIARFVHPDDRAKVESANSAVIKDQELGSIEYRIVRPDGSVHTLLDRTGEMALDRTGRPFVLIGVVLDITDRRCAEAEKEAMEAQLVQAQKMDAIGQLAGGVAHDFNNLLTGILGNIGIIRSDLPTSSPLAANLLAVETAARQAADLAKGLLTFSHKAVVSPVPLNMADTLDATLAILKQSLPATMNIVRDVEQATWSVLADQAQIAQVILNLAVNARDAMEGRGTFTVSIKNVHVDEDYARTHSFARTGDFVHVSFADTGPGIPDEVREHLFEPFFTTKAADSGTGLGLSIVYGAIKQANGWITVDSSPGLGATFDVFLPRCLAEPSTVVPLSRSAVAICSCTVLVVEDEPVVSAVAQALLKRSGCTVLAAGDGASALALIREHEKTVDLILLDMTMPGMSTDDIVQAIRQIDAHVPILLTSGYTSGGTVSSMLAAGTVQGFLPKPYEAGQLTDSVQRLMRRQ